MGGAMDLLVGAKGSHCRRWSTPPRATPDREEVQAALHRRPLHHPDHHRDVRHQRVTDKGLELVDPTPSSLWSRSQAATEATLMCLPT